MRDNVMVSSLGNPEMPMGANSIDPNKSLLSLAR